MTGLAIDSEVLGASSVTNISNEEMRNAALALVGAAVERDGEADVKTVLMMIGVDTE